jgi:hypothetical protein
MPLGGRETASTSSSEDGKSGRWGFGNWLMSLSPVSVHLRPFVRPRRRCPSGIPPRIY